MCAWLNITRFVEVCAHAVAFDDSPMAPFTRECGKAFLIIESNKNREESRVRHAICSRHRAHSYYALFMCLSVCRRWE